MCAIFSSTHTLFYVSVIMLRTWPQGYWLDAYIPKNGIRIWLFTFANTKKRQDHKWMDALPDMEEGQFSTRPPRFNG